MNVNNYIYDWIFQFKRTYGLITETNIPMDDELIRKSFRAAVSNEQYSPTIEFLKKVYDIFNDEFFDNKLTTDLSFDVVSKPRDSLLGSASVKINRIMHTTEPTKICLNGAKILSMHEWLETILHEMIHVYDYEYNSHHFFDIHYDAHGEWFMNFGKQFEKYGFHVQKYSDAIIGVNTDDRKVKNMIDKSVFIILRGMGAFKKYSGDPIYRINSKNVEKYKTYMKRKKDRGCIKGTTQLEIVKSSNPEIVNLSELRMQDEWSTVRFYFLTDEFQNKYGPFETIEKVDINDIVTEDNDEVEYDDVNHIDDEYARKIYDNISNVVDLKKIKDGEYEVAIA